MAAPLLPQDVTEHLEAAIQLSNRHIHLRFLDEAERLLSLHLPAAGIAVAGVVLESLMAGQRSHRDPDELQHLDKWSQLRNAALHPQGPVPSVDAAREMVAGVRRLLLGRAIAGARLAVPNPLPEGIRGKYKFVPTSSSQFIARKRDELRLEHQ